MPLCAGTRWAEAQRAGARCRRLGCKTGAELLGRKGQGERKVTMAKTEMGHKVQPVGFREH